MEGEARAGVVSGLSGRRILVLEARLPSILADLVARRGGEAVCVPVAVEVEAPASAVAAPLGLLCARKVDLVVLQTGVGTVCLHRQATGLGLGDAYLETLRSLPVAVRGPKPAAILHRWGIHPALAARSPYTTDELCAALAEHPMSEKTAFVQHYGEMNERLREYLQRRGATTVDALPYRWALPANLDPLRKAVAGLQAGAFDALLITSRPQVTHLFEVAEAQGEGGALREALNSRVTVAVVGPVARRALDRRGVRAGVEPSHPKMAPLVDALAAHFAQAGAP
ncbi:MAG: uroporphyrinogen-III synthase [Bacillati bacterium ANGP1]|uniref:Uroporphyrinogen-III synthase n=1 Tax=Candidatus Segetimicrobium genomatis TaxID=2569760 RepID=A0A537K524_9BACT|nr:MAG: uroporphyrinogen-III synthase [Terrabacteria group bacterium ANGP1]